MPIISGGGGIAAPATLTAPTAGSTPLTVKGASGQTADLFNVNNSAGASIIETFAAGGVYIASRVNSQQVLALEAIVNLATDLFDISNPNGTPFSVGNNGNVLIAPNGSGNGVGLEVSAQATSGQTSDLIRAKDPNGDVVFQVGVAGLVRGQGAHLSPITSGALPTVALVSGTGTQLSTARDVVSHTPVTFNPGVATTATVTVALSPDNVTYSTLAVVTKPVGTVFDGEIDDIVVPVPAGWYLKLTVNAQAVLGTTTYH